MAQQVYDDEVLGRAFDAGLTKKALAFILPYKRQIAVAFAAMLINAGAPILAPQLVRYAIDKGMRSGNIRMLGILALAYAGTYLVYWGTQYWQGVLVSWLGQHVIYDIRRRLFSHIQSLSLSFFDRHEVGRIISRLTSDVDALNALLTSGSLTLFVDMVTLLVVTVLMLQMNLKLGLLILILSPVLGAVTWAFRSKSRIAYRDIRKKVATVTANMAENVSGVRVVKSFSRERENLQHFKSVNNENREAVMHAVMLSSVFQVIIEVIFALGLCMVFWYGGLQIASGVLTLGILTAFYLYLDQFFGPIRRMSTFYQTMQGAMAGAERIFEILDTVPSVADAPGAGDMPSIRGRVEFRDVSFAYRDEPIIRNMSFCIEAGETVALVGPTGAGKTTIVSLIGRQYDVSSGSILVDGTDIRSVRLHSLRTQIGVVLQDSFIFPGMVKDNIRYGRPDATDEEVVAAAKTIGAHDFIEHLPRGYNTRIQEGASNLSGGQKQLLSFARALLTEPRILVLDEATSSIDTSTEILIQEALRKLSHGRTSIVIAHRLSTIERADKILVIEDGRVQESGTHAELLAHEDGLYRKLYEIQFRHGAGF
jgi:ABC-type multidrug transport system fused ATPase/permease subunit